MKLVIIEPLGVEEDKLMEIAHKTLPDSVEIVSYQNRVTDTESLIKRGCDADVIMVANLPLNAEVIKVEDEDYGIWYIDAMERPQVYEGKTVEMRVQVQRSPKMPPGMIIPGRKAMTCCEDDMTFIGYLCRLNQTKSKTLKRILNNEWVTYNEAYDKTMPILTAIRIEKSEPPKEQLVYF